MYMDFPVNNDVRGRALRNHVTEIFLDQASLRKQNKE